MTLTSNSFLLVSGVSLTVEAVISVVEAVSGALGITSDDSVRSEFEFSAAILLTCVAEQARRVALDGQIGSRERDRARGDGAELRRLVR